MASDEVRFVVVKPGDVLLVSCAALSSDEACESVAAFAREIGVRVAVFEGDINIGSLSADDLARLKADPDGGKA